MKTRILTAIISFIFLFVCYADTVYAVTDEVIHADEATEQADIVENTAANQETENEENSVEEEIIEEVAVPKNEENVVENTNTDENLVMKDTTVQMNTSATNYKGEVCLDTPASNASFTRPDTSSIKVAGWAVSDDSNAKVRMLLDGKVVNANLGRIARADVNNAKGNTYGGTANTPKAGFTGTLDISNVAAGSHILRLEQYSRIGSVIGAAEIAINVANKKYRGEVCIDTPAAGKTVSSLVESKIAVAGWAVSDDSGAKVRMLVDGKVVNANLGRIARADVNNAKGNTYGGAANTPKPGFSVMLDISSYTVGAHAIRIEEYSRYGDVIARYEVNINVSDPKYTGEICLDTPTANKTLTRPDNNKVTVAGWAVSDDSSAKVRLYVDGKVVNANLGRIARADVSKAKGNSYGGTKTTPRPGFSAVLDISNYALGNHKLKVEQYTRAGTVVGSREITVKVVNRNYRGEMCLDTPKQHDNITKPDSNKLTLKGWAVSDDSNTSFKVFIDNGVVASTVSRNARSDVDRLKSPNYGGTANTPKAGFAITIDITNYNAGTHKLRVEQYSRFGVKISSVEINVNMVNKKYSGEVCIDVPKNNATLTKPDNNKVTVAGWAVSNDSGAKVRMLVDGKVVNANLGRLVRADVNNAKGNTYGGTACTPRAGFSGTMDISNLAVGAHKLRIEEYSRFGDVIKAQEFSFKVANKRYQGLVCIDTPRNNTNFTRPDTTKIAVEGWAVSNDSGAKMRVLLDGKVAANNLNRIKRADVDKLKAPSYGGTACTPKAGYLATLDISSLGKGAHKIRVEEFSRYGDVISYSEIGINIVNKSYAGVVCLDTPKHAQKFTRPDTAKITLSGWAVSTDSGATVRVLIDGSVAVKSAGRTVRADVNKSQAPKYGGTACTPKAGFSGTADVSKLDKGAHKIRVEQLSRFGDVISYSEININIVNKQYVGEMVIDAPGNGQAFDEGSNMSVTGWAVSGDYYATVKIFIDNALKATADRSARSDLAVFVSRNGNQTPNPGFGKTISLAGLGAGNHTLTVQQQSRYGDSIISQSRTITIKTKAVANQAVLNNGDQGIDVAVHQGNINWSQVAGSGIKFAMIRIGYRGYRGGREEDSMYKRNFAGAVANGLKVGVYFYTTAINTTEALSDADYAVGLLKKYGYQNQLSMPIAVDLEDFPGARDANVSRDTRTAIANTFCSRIQAHGYTPMVYASKAYLSDRMDYTKVPYQIWVAQYNTRCTFKGSYSIWQRSSTGSVPGIAKNVDLDVYHR